MAKKKTNFAEEPNLPSKSPQNLTKIGKTSKIAKNCQICLKLPKLPKWAKNGQIGQKCRKCLNAKTAKFTQNPPKLPKMAQMAKKIQILPKGILPKGQMCLQNPLKFDQNWENPKNCQKVLILPNLSKIAQVGQKRPNWPKMPKMPKFWHVPPHPLHTMIQQSRDRSVQHLHTQIL